ncbi:NFACT RNA binding domain-containing protein [Mongoliitalea daihaiensis]|uniref:NFACT RNA binding domain-containing protein n=1 Tax=Mongoliitalea daihaiensis TaxID=2782006 RepID=UPI001F17B6DD|nr:NFACT RNA binding domain-containing protein [Mongoliitalea daihaiensis]UJP64600.1 DUF814 domain-containing protein [Mongoliitalea daihaiensis]
MHLNYHFLKFLCPELDSSFQGFQIRSCFSQNKDELVILLQKDEQTACIRANLLPIYSCLSFPKDFKRSKKNTVNLFDEWIGQEVHSITPLNYERAFTINLKSGDVIIFKLHGTRSNILYYKSSEEYPIKIFRNEIREDLEILKDSLSVQLDLSFERFNELAGNASKFLPTLGKIPREWLKSQGYIDADLNTKWSLIQEVQDRLESPLFSIVQLGGEYHLSLLPEHSVIFQSSKAIEACNELFRYRVVVQTFHKEKAKWVRQLEDQLKKSQAYIQKTEEKLLELLDQNSPAQKADVLMANLHQIPRGAVSATLFNFYTNQEEEFSWKQGVSPQKVAENFYRKSKNRKIEINQLEENLRAKERLVEQLQEQRSELLTIEDFKSLRQFVKDNNFTHTAKSQEETVPFKRFEIDSFEVLVGKSAKANDELLRRYAWKEDLWLHAKDVSGSHVLIKYKSGIPFPSQVIEKAAALAAYYSKNKNESLAAVIVTPAKYVRKAKGSAPGAVMVDKEKTVLVIPQDPASI